LEHIDFRQAEASFSFSPFHLSHILAHWCRTVINHRFSERHLAD